MITKGSGCFALCEECWNELTPEERIPYYEQLIADWELKGAEKIYHYLPWFIYKRLVLKAVREEQGNIHD